MKALLPILALTAQASPVEAVELVAPTAQGATQAPARAAIQTDLREPAISAAVGLPVDLVRSLDPAGTNLWHYAVDPHVHSRLSGDARGSLRQIKAAGRRAHLDAVVITDHGGVRAKAAIAKANRRGRGPVLVPGAEAAIKEAHVGLWNIPRLPARRAGDRRTGRLAMVRRLAEQAPSSLAVLNHPHWRRIGARYFAPRWLDPSAGGPRFDAVELWNGKAPLRKKTRAMIMRWESLLGRGLRPSIVGASDAHRPSDVGRVQTIVMARSLDPADLVDAVRAGRTYLTDGPRMRFEVNGVGPGDVLAPEAPGRVEYTARGHCAGRRILRVFSGRSVVTDIEVGPGLFERRLTLDVASDTWLRAELLHPARRAGARKRPSLITAPVYVDVAPLDDKWKPPPAAWRQQAKPTRLARLK